MLLFVTTFVAMQENDVCVCIYMYVCIYTKQRQLRKGEMMHNCSHCHSLPCDGSNVYSLLHFVPDYVLTLVLKLSPRYVHVIRHLYRKAKRGSFARKLYAFKSIFDPLSCSMT